MWVIFPFREQDGKDRVGQMDCVWTRIKSVYPCARRCIARQAAGLKFNRGLLLNVGFQCCCHDESWVVFHDVDLLPDDELLQSYKPANTAAIAHLAHSFARYSSPHYFGGIHAMRGRVFTALNGFPNKFWGWGGEDDELYRRTVQAGVGIQKPRGQLQDLEDLPLGVKLQELRQTEAKCKNKREVAEQYKRGYADGLKQIWNINMKVTINRLSERTLEVVVQP
jgi:hypothetical protein